MRQADVHRFALADPGDVSGLAGAIASGLIDPVEIVAVIGKTHGNGLVNDYTRGFLTLGLSDLLATALGRSRAEVTAKVPFIFSGGVEGVLSPHYSVFTIGHAKLGARPGPALAIGTAVSLPLAPADIGTNAQIAATADAVRQAMAEADIAPADVHLVQVKGPAPNLASIAASDRPCRTGEPGKLMAYGRAASALGVALALREIGEEYDLEAAVLARRDLFSSVASISAGTEVHANEVVVLGMSAAWTGPLAISHRTMADALDLAGVDAALRDLGFAPSPTLTVEETARLRTVFVKCEPARSGLVRGRRHTMLDDGDMDAQRHIRGALGGLVAGMTGETQLFVSGGAEHQGPDGGGLIAIVAER